MKNLTQDEKREIATMYADKSIKVQEIADTYGIERAEVRKIAVDNGCSPRQISKDSNRFSELIIQSILEDYRNNVKVIDIAEKYGIGHSTVSRIARTHGLELRHNKKRNKKSGKLQCQHCRRIIDLKDISFCPYCGKDIRTEEQLLIEDLQNSLGIIATSQMPSSSKDKIRNSLLEAIKWIKNNKGE